MPSIKKSVFLLTLTCIFSLLLTAGCDNSLDPVDDEKGLYSIYGALNIDENINYIRVKNLNIPLNEETTDNIDAEVILSNLDAGISETLEDTVVQFDDVHTHNFYTTLDITPETDYEITVERSDGRTARATATTPPIATTQIGPTGETCYTPIQLSFEPVNEEDYLDLSIGFELNGTTYWANLIAEQDENNPEKISLSFSPKDILDDQFDPLTGNQICCFQLSSREFYVRYNHFGPDFYEEVSTDTISIPGGVGTFGGMYDRSFSFEIDTSRVMENPPCIE